MALTWYVPVAAGVQEAASRALVDLRAAVEASDDLAAAVGDEQRHRGGLRAQRIAHLVVEADGMAAEAMCRGTTRGRTGRVDRDREDDGVSTPPAASVARQA